MPSRRPTIEQLCFDFSDEAERCVAPEPQRGQSTVAVMEKPALDSTSNDLMERVVAWDNIERAWKNVKANRGAPGPDGVSVTDFPVFFRIHWPEIRQQLLEGTYRPGAARRKSIPKEDGGERNLAIPNGARIIH